MKRNIKVNYQYNFLQYFVVTGLWMLYLTKKGFSPFEVGLMEAIFHGTSMLFEVPSGSIGDRFGYRKTLIASRIMNIFSCLLCVLATNFW
ncbi:MFS family permease [Enterococcus sp. PF1-24]|nr:MFS family permease [Enterococcus sp. PFB1-1]MDH6402611.1 MFS family permease [Enterococcus sp. PF1-24]